jgi:hypothetical protein
MKTLVLSSALIFVLIFTSCGPAAEDKKVMHANAKIFQDSLANMIRTSMAEAEAPANPGLAPVQTPTAAPAGTVK